MENNELNKNLVRLNEENNVESKNEEKALEETENKNWTNDQKLDYLTKLIQDADKNLEINGISKKLSK